MGHGTDDRDVHHAAAHGAYKDFRKYKELQTRMQEQVNLMDHDLSFAPTATAAAITKRDQSAKHVMVAVNVDPAGVADQRAVLSTKGQSVRSPPGGSTLTNPRDGLVIINPLYNE
jgi:predicted phosphoribosyltransferase